MAVDEALWETLSPASPPAICLHAFAEESITLGFMQRAEELAHAGLGHLPWTRRITGGGAIHHRPGAVSFALIGPQTPRGRSPLPVACDVGKALVFLWANLGKQTHVLAEGDPATLGAAMCVDRRYPGDVLRGDRKVAGIAQRQRGGRLLVQCALMEETGKSPDEVGPIIARVFGLRFHAPIEESELSPEERRAAERLRSEKYATDRWRRRR